MAICRDISKRIQIVALIGSLTLMGSGVQAAPPIQISIPEGSYRQTCFNISAIGDADFPTRLLSANCKPKQSSILVVNTNFDFRFCMGNIENRDGQLWCQINAQAKATTEAQDALFIEQQKTAEANYAAMEAEKLNVAASVAGFTAAAPVVLGRDPLSYGFGGRDTTTWYYMMKNDQLFAADLSEGVSYSEALKFLKRKIRTPEWQVVRMAITEYAVMEVHGRGPTPYERVEYDPGIVAGNFWYQNIVQAERTKTQAGMPAREDMIRTAYQRIFGRSPAPREMPFWMGRSDVYRGITNQILADMYSDTSLVQLTATAGTVLRGANKASSPANISKVITEARRRRADFEGMTNFIFSIGDLGPNIDPNANGRP